jgi:farnesyl-diphosphate farnesyltransferase
MISFQLEPVIRPQEFYLSHQQRNYLQSFMGKVSRTFATVTPCFEEPLDLLMSAAYLIFRVADNIEDCGETYAEQQVRFQQFRQLLQQPSFAETILQDWSQRSWIGLDLDQQQLMQPKHGLMLWQIYTSIPNPAQNIIKHWVTEMVKGIEKLRHPNRGDFIDRDKVRILASVEDYNYYCYLVAGTVGHMGTELAINHYQLNDNESQSLLATCEACGNALQKTNILKDFVTDLATGFCYLPLQWLEEIDNLPLHLKGAPKDWTNQVLTDALKELNQSVLYVLSIPYRAVGYRLASLICLLPAYQTLLLAAQGYKQLFTADHTLKISRECFYNCMHQSQQMVRDNDALRQYVTQVQQQIETAWMS